MNQPPRALCENTKKPAPIGTHPRATASLSRVVARAMTSQIPPHDPHDFPRRSTASPSTSARDGERRTCVSWNCGLRGLRVLTESHRAATRSTGPDEHGVTRASGYGSLAGLLHAFGDDVGVVCFQETKLNGGDVERLSRADGWDGAHSTCRAKSKSGYAGVAVYWRSDGLCPLAIEEGVCGTRMRANASSSMWPGETPPMATNRRRGEELDDEGRALWVDFDAFVLCTVYVPAVFGDPANDDKTADRAAFKADFLRALEERCASLRRRGRAVVLCGDWNIAPSWKRDRAHEKGVGVGVEPRNPSREWMARMLDDGGGGFRDAFREAHPKSVDVYTCWNVASGAQLHNYGSRIDYFLCDREISMAHVERVGVARHFEGSDHAPVFLRLQSPMWRRRRPDQTPPSLALSALYPGRQTTITDAFTATERVSKSTAESTLEYLERASRAKSVPPPKKRKAAEPTMKDFFAVRDPKPNHRETPPPPPTTTTTDTVAPPTTTAKSHAVDEWTRAFAKMAPPRCAHGDVCKARAVQKRDSPNYGRVFFCCPRPAGPRDNPSCDCGFFAWRDRRSSKPKQ